MNIFTTLIDWTNATFLPFGALGLFVLAMIEAFFFPIPPDLLLITFSLNNPNNAIFYAAIATFGSVLGGIIGYYIGLFCEQTFLEKVVSKRKLEKAHNLFNKYEGWAIFIAAFTPIPYKVFTIAAGLFYVDMKKFIYASFIARGLRFTIEALLIIYYGEEIVLFLSSTFNLYTILAVLSIIGLYLLYKYGYRNLVERRIIR